MSGRELGRISGPLLADNLKRNGTNLAFDNKVLFLDVVNKRIGFNSSTPITDLYTPNSIRSTNLIVTDTSDIGNWVISGHTIQYVLNSPIIISPNQASSPNIVTPSLSTSNLYISNNTLSSTGTNNDINLTANGSGSINFNNGVPSVQVTVNGDLHATGNITFDGNITLGNQSTDTITLVGEINSDIIPVVETVLITPASEQFETEDFLLYVAEDGETLYTDPGNPYYAPNPVYNLGSDALEWNVLYTNNFTINSQITSTLNATTAILGSSGNITISGNQIAIGASDVTLKTTGTGLVSINGTYFINGSNIQNTTNGALTINSTGAGYVKFAGTFGLAIPVGSLLDYPIAPVIGTVRFNTDLNYGEVYNGTEWIPVKGNAPVLSTSEVADSNWAWDIILG
jgi:hypothetical protein